MGIHWRKYQQMTFNVDEWKSNLIIPLNHQFYEEKTTHRLHQPAENSTGNNLRFYFPDRSTQFLLFKYTSLLIVSGIYTIRTVSQLVCTNTTALNL